MRWKMKKIKKNKKSALRKKTQSVVVCFSNAVPAQTASVGE